MWVSLGLVLVCAFLIWPETMGRRFLRRRTGAAPLFKATGSHWRRNYGRRAFLRLGGVTLLAGVLAYSGADEAVDSFHARRVRGSLSDGISGRVKILGERFWFLNWLLVGAMDAWLLSNPFTRFGRENFEAMVVGLPVLWTVQRGLGANRPSSSDPDPRWRPLRDDHAASGHTFISAVPWLTLARRLDRLPSRKAMARGGAGLARVASWATGWSRINDRKHYLSQVILGWTIAWNAVDAVSGSAARDSGSKILPEERNTTP